MGRLERVWPPNRFQAAIVLLVGVSGGLVSFSAGAPPTVAVAATVLGLLVGVACAAYLTWIVPTRDVPDRRKRR